PARRTPPRLSPRPRPEARPQPRAATGHRSEGRSSLTLLRTGLPRSHRSRPRENRLVRRAGARPCGPVIARRRRRVCKDGYVPAVSGQRRRAWLSVFAVTVCARRRAFPSVAQGATGSARHTMTARRREDDAIMNRTGSLSGGERALTRRRFLGTTGAGLTALA